MATALFTRWFQIQVLAPDFRVPFSADPSAPHGGPHPSQTVLHDFIRLRRRLAPYVESTPETIVAAAAPDYGAFARVGGRVAPYAFGPAIRVCPAPVLTEGGWRVTLPAGGRWFDFWTGASFAGGDIVRVPAPIERLPLFVRAGSIIPLAPLGADDAASTGPCEIRIYPGADGKLAWRTPTGTVPLTWDDHARTLRAEAARAARRCMDFELVVVRPGRGVGLRGPTRADATVRYDGDTQEIRSAPPPARPAAPVGLMIRVEGSRAHARWQEPSAGVLYRLKRVSDTGEYHEDIASVLPGPEHSFSLASDETPFHCSVTAMNAGGESDPSPIVPVAAIRPRAPRTTRLGDLRQTG